MTRISELPQGEPVAVIVRRLSEHAQADIELISALREAVSFRMHG